MSTIWSDTLLLTLLGMGTVFVFLLLLVLALGVMSSLIGRFATEEKKDEPTTQDIELAAVAAAAYRQYRK